jgi:acyl-CoA thioesterase-1
MHRRYVRLNMLKNSANPGVHVVEFKVFDGTEDLEENEPHSSGLVPALKSLSATIGQPRIMQTLATLLCITLTTTALATEHDGKSTAPKAESTTESTKKAGARFMEELKQGRHITIVTLGTSLTGGTWRWPDVMKEWLDKEYPGLVTMHNLGVGASASSHPPGRSGLDMAKQCATLKPDVVFIEFATNDVYLPYKISLADSKKNLNSIIDTVLAANRQAEIILQTMNSCKDKPGSGPHATVRPQLADYFQGYRDVAKARGLLLVDHYPNWLKIMTEEPERFDRLVPDCIHPQTEGYQQILLPVLKRALLGNEEAVDRCT